MEQKKTKEKYFCLLGQSVRDWRFWFKLLIGSMQLISILTFIIIATAVEGDIYALPEHLSYYTTWTNFFSAIFFLYSAFFHHTEGKGKFNNDQVAQIVITYLTLTILVYNINQLIAEHPYSFDSWKYIMSLVCEHTLGPILAIIYYLCFYNHKNIKNIKEFSKKWVWYMIAGLLFYLVLFSIIGFLGKAFDWKALYGTMDGSDESSTFVYPFIDWYHGVGLFRPAWLECLLIVILIIGVETGFDYLYSFTAIKINQSHWQDKFLKK